jgi:hypothetical protein
MKRGSTMTPRVSEAFRSAAMRRSAAIPMPTPNGILLLWATLEGPLEVCAVVGAGKQFFPDRVRLKLELVDERRFSGSVVVLRYAVGD